MKRQKKKEGKEEIQLTVDNSELFTYVLLQCYPGLFAKHTKAEEFGIMSNPEGQLSLGRSLNCC